MLGFELDDDEGILDGDTLSDGLELGPKLRVTDGN